jgi:hypothetical protein
MCYVLVCDVSVLVWVLRSCACMALPGAHDELTAGVCVKYTTHNGNIEAVNVNNHLSDVTS